MKKSSKPEEIEFYEKSIVNKLKRMIKIAKDQTLKVTLALKDAAETVLDMKSKVNGMTAQTRANINQEKTRLNESWKVASDELLQLEEKKCGGSETFFSGIFGRDKCEKRNTQIKKLERDIDQYKKKYLELVQLEQRMINKIYKIEKTAAGVHLVGQGDHEDIMKFNFVGG